MSNCADVEELEVAFLLPLTKHSFKSNTKDGVIFVESQSICENGVLLLLVHMC